MPDATPAQLDSRLAERDAALVYPASSAQRRLWFLDQLERATALYNVCKCVRLQGDLDVIALNRAFDEIARRHEILRTTFGVADGEPVQLVHPPGPVAFALDDLSRCP